MVATADGGKAILPGGQPQAVLEGSGPRLGQRSPDVATGGLLQHHAGEVGGDAGEHIGLVRVQVEGQLQAVSGLCIDRGDTLICGEGKEGRRSTRGKAAGRQIVDRLIELVLVVGDPGTVSDHPAAAVTAGQLRLQIGHHAGVLPRVRRGVDASEETELCRYLELRQPPVDDESSGRRGAGDR